MLGYVTTFLAGVNSIGALRRAFFTQLQRLQPSKRSLEQIAKLRFEEEGVPSPYTDVFRVFFIEDASRFIANLNGFRYVKIPNFPSFLMQTPGVNNSELPSSFGGPPDWAVVQEGTSSIPILGDLLPQDYVDEIRTSLAIPEGCFTACP